MDALKALKEKLKKEKEDLGVTANGDKKFVKKAELEAARLKRLREEEEEERKKKVAGAAGQEHTGWATSWNALELQGSCRHGGVRGPA